MTSGSVIVGRCASCDAPVFFVRTTKGKTMPVEPTLATDGNIEIRDGVAHVVAPGQGAYVSHFASCPHAAAWRRRA